MIDLFDIIDREEAKEHPEDCRHAKERKAEAVWPDRPDLKGPHVWCGCAKCAEE